MSLIFGKNLLLPLLAVGVLAAAFASVRAQYQIKAWTTDDGLPQNTIHSMVQTRDGYVWLATLDGLVRFDGVRFTIFNKNNTKGIIHNRFTQIVVDAHDDLWVGTENGAITRYHESRFESYPITDGLLGFRAMKMVLDDKGELVVFANQNILRWNGGQFVPYSPVAGETGESLVLWSKSGAFWYSDKQTLHRFQDNQITDYRLPADINRVFEDSRGRLWIGTNSAGLFVLENGKLSVYDFKNPLLGKQVSSLMEDKNGNIWIADSQGAIIIAADGKVDVLRSEQGLSDNILTTLYEDREGNIWIGTLFRGLNRLSRNSVTFYSKKDGLAGNVTRPIYQAQGGDVWIGGERLTRYQAGSFYPIAARKNLEQSQEVTAIEQDRAGRLWFGHWVGVYFYENGEFTDFTSKFGLKATFPDIHQDRDGAMWFASNAGLFRYQNETMTHWTTAEGLPSNDVKIIHESPDGTLWIGTYGGLVRLDGEKGRKGEKETLDELGSISPSPHLPFSLSVFTTADGLASNLVRSLYEDREGVLWIGSYDGGLTRLKDGKLTRYTSSDGLFNDGVFQILEDERGWLWMSSNRGIYRVAKQQLDDFADGRIPRIESTAYGKDDGLLETECNGGQQPAGMKASDGKLWFPTQRGVAVIDPKNVETNPYPPPVVIESIKIDNILSEPSVPTGGLAQIKISPNENNLEIAYTGLSFIKPEFVKFRYKLEGQDADWIEADTRRTAYYSYLPPGDYTFRVIAANSDGVWNTAGATLKVVVQPPFYRTWWFWVLPVVFIIGAVVIFYRWRIRQLERAQQAQAEFSRKLLASQEQERQRIAAELHDSIGQSLLIIKNRAFLALSDFNEPETVREQLEELSESATGAIEECREISYNLRPYQINRFGLTKTLEAIFRRISEVMPIETTIELDSVDDLFSSEAETNIYRVVQESVNNIIKHSDASEAAFFIKRRGDTIDILIRDNGRGFDKNAVGENGDARGGFGLVGTAERVRMLGGVYEIESAPDKGTSIKIKLGAQAASLPSVRAKH